MTSEGKDMIDEEEPKWPREIWLAELDEHHNGQARAVLSEFATVPRFEGCPDTDCDFQRYVDGDIFDSADKYWRQRIEALTAEHDNYKAQTLELQGIAARRQAQIAAAYEDAARCVLHNPREHEESQRMWVDERPYVCEESAYRRVKGRTPAEASTALAAMLREAERRGAEKMREAAAISGEKYTESCQSCAGVGIRIRALDIDEVLQ